MTVKRLGRLTSPKGRYNKKKQKLYFINGVTQEIMRNDKIIFYQWGNKLQ